MSDIGILSSPFAIAMIVLMLGAQGLAIGGIAGALAWRGRRIRSAALGAAIGFGLELLGWAYFTDNL